MMAPAITRSSLHRKVSVKSISDLLCRVGKKMNLCTRTMIFDQVVVKCVQMPPKRKCATS